jgi:tetratricopeptide (TPR) repeat protein
MRLEFEQATVNCSLPESAEPSSSPISSESSADIIKRGIAAARAGNRSQARILLKHAVEIEPDSETAWMWLASTSEYPEELLVFLDHVLLINPKNLRAIEWKEATEELLAKTFVKRAVDAAEAGANESAIQYFKEALRYDDQNPTAWSWLAQLQVTQPGKNEFLNVQQPSPTVTEEVQSPVFVQQMSLPTEAPKHYIPPHSESVVLHPIPTFAGSDDGPTQELVFHVSVV